MSTDDNKGQSRQQSGSPDPLPSDGAPGYEDSSRKDEVALLDIFLVLARQKVLIVRTVLAFALLGATYALLTPEEYTSNVEMVREAQDGGGGLSGNLPGGIGGGALSGLGISLGGASSGLTTAAFPEVMKSREVRLSVVRDTFRFPEGKEPMSFVDYVNRPPSVLDLIFEYTLKLPWTLKDAVMEAIAGPPAPTETKDGELVIPSEEEDRALRSIDEMVSVAVDEETGIVSLSVTAESPRLAADLAKRFLHHFTIRVRTIRTEKVKERLSFVKERFQEAEEELDSAEDRLAQFLERNQNPTSPVLQFQRDRLQRQVRFKEQLFSDLQGQLTQTQLDLQRKSPVVTVVEKPDVPLERSAPQRTLIVIVAVLFGGVVSVGGAFLKSYLDDQKMREEERGKISEIKQHLSWGQFKTSLGLSAKNGVQQKEENV